MAKRPQVEGSLTKKEKQVVVIEELLYTAAEHTPPSAKYRTGRVSQAA